ncbi:hypothetical protein BOX15_Mlig030152g1, partial [Macrostomum lignano]
PTMELPGRGSLVVLDSDSQSYTGFFRKMTNDFQFELYDARDENGRYIGKVCVPLDQVSKLLVSEEMSDPESCSSCGESSIESSATAAAAAAATESRLTCSSPGSRTASEEPAAARQNNFGLRQKPFLPPKCPVPKHYGGILLGSNEKHQHGMLNLLPEVDATSCLPDGFIYDANFNEATNANCILVTTAIGVERALAVLATADLLAVLCHGGNLRGQAKTSSRPSLISVAMPINDINSRVFLFDLDSCTAAAMSGLAKLLSSCREPYNRHLVVVSYDCRLLKRHLPMLDCSANDASVKFVDLQVLSTTLQQLYSDGKCSHACRGLYCLMQTYLGKPDPYKEPRAREDFLVEDSAVWRRRPLHPALLVASYDKSRQVLPLYNEMLSALLNPVYRASKDRMLAEQQAEDVLDNPRHVQHRYCNLFAPWSNFLGATTVADAATASNTSRKLRHARSAAAKLDQQSVSAAAPVAASVAAPAPKSPRLPSDVTLGVSKATLSSSVDFVSQLAKAEESGLPSNYFCSIPSQAALDQMRNLHVKGDAVKQPDEVHHASGSNSTVSCYSTASSSVGGGGGYSGRGRGIRRSAELEFDIAPGCSDESAATSCLRIPQADSAQQSRGRCRGGSSAALQQRQQQSPCSPITSSTANSTVGSLTPNHSSLPSFGFGRGRGGSGGSGSNLLGSAAGGVGVGF